jgi:hypothetical protein
MALLFRPFAALTLALIASPTLAQPSNVSSAHKFSWAENCGWMNFRDAGSPTRAQGARLSPGHHYLAGFVWGDNIGWIHLGSGTPANGVAYANLTGAASGVTSTPATGQLSGLAWGENVGWINFSGGAMATPANPARVTTTSPRRLAGLAWGENIGWINLDDSANYVGLLCPVDFNLDEVLSVQDIFDFLGAWFALDPAADFNGGGVAVQDIFDYLNAWFAGC